MRVCRGPSDTSPQYVNARRNTARAAIIEESQPVQNRDLSRLSKHVCKYQPAKLVK